VELRAVDDDRLQVHARALLHGQAPAHEARQAVEGGAKTARGNFGVKEAQLDAAASQLVEGPQDRAEAAPQPRPLDDQLLDVGGGDPDRALGGEDAVADHALVERAPGEELAAEEHAPKVARTHQSGKKSCYRRRPCASRSTAARSTRRTWPT